MDTPEIRISVRGHQPKRAVVEGFDPEMDVPGHGRFGIWMRFRYVRRMRGTDTVIVSGVQSVPADEVVVL